MTPPTVSCLCPTFRRPRLLENALACFVAQDYPGPAELVVIDDAGQLAETQIVADPALVPRGIDLAEHPRSIHILSLDRRFRTLPEKFNALAALARGTVLAVWEDDDIYLPWHLRAHVAALGRTGAGWSKPSEVLSLYTGRLQKEEAIGRFHASLAFDREVFERAGGWPITGQLEFDQVFLERLARAAQLPAADCCRDERPSYIFRWGSTGSYHGQALGPDWYAAAERFRADAAPVERLQIGFDAETARIMQRLAHAA